MPFLVTALVGFLVLPVSVTAPIPAEAAQTALVPVASPYTKVAKAPFTAKLTAYNAVPAQTDSNPFVTASGAFSNPEVVAARSSDLASTLPFGTVIKIERTLADTPACNFSKVESQIGYRVIADAMNPRIVNTVDVLLDQNQKVEVHGRVINPALAVGRCSEVTVSVLGKLPVRDIPATQAELAAMVEGGAVELAQR